MSSRTALKFLKTEGLLSIGEGFYEISMITREKRLQDALNKIIYYNVISVWSLVNDKKMTTIKIWFWIRTQDLCGLAAG